MKKCKKCFYLGRSTWTCDYYLLTGERRGCPVDNCERFLDRDASKENKAKGTIISRNLEKIREMYYAGMSDYKIAAAIGCSVNAVFKWRKREGLIATNKRRKNDAGNGRI